MIFLHKFLFCYSTVLFRLSKLSCSSLTEMYVNEYHLVTSDTWIIIIKCWIFFRCFHIWDIYDWFSIIVCVFSVLLSLKPHPRLSMADEKCRSQRSLQMILFLILQSEMLQERDWTAAGRKSGGVDGKRGLSEWVRAGLWAACHHAVLTVQHVAMEAVM